MKTYPAFFTPRDKEPSLSSSEFGWLEIKRKIKEKEKQSKALYILYIYISILHTSISISGFLQWMQGNIYRNLMIGGLQGEEWKFIQKYLKEKI